MEVPDNIRDTKHFADIYFDFLVTEYSFARVPEYYVAHEYHRGYRKDKIEIDIVCEADGTSLPWVTLRNYNKTRIVSDKEYPEYFYLTEIEIPDSIKIIFARRSDRYFPTGSKTDYRERGRSEVEVFLRTNAEIIKRHKQILSGNLKVFPKQQQNNSSIISLISIRQPDGKVKTYSTETKRRKSLIEWIKSLFK